MVSVMSSDFDLENQVDDDETRVSSSKPNVETDLNLNEDVRVSSRNDLGEIEETRVSDGDGARVLGERNGDSGNLLLDDRETESTCRDEDASNEVVVVSDSDNRGGGKEDSGLSSGSDLDGVSDGVEESGAVRDGEGVERVGEFRLEKRKGLRDAGSNDVGGGEMSSVVRANSMKVRGTEFEMGDMVWGKVKSHPWWPGHIFSDAFATSSVRRTRRDGNILVAFFGDSSYGWFDPTELVPYEPHYAEKSQQTNSRSFVRAVEESVDEASRRSALGLSCRCRNPYNFRPANVPGYLSVDVVDYEPGAVYSVNQILKARESFRPAETLSFIKQLAAAPSSDESKSLDAIKQKAAALAYRRSTYEEFDETYAQAFQAFGHEPVKSSQKPVADKKPSRAPLSGPQVFADSIGSRKSSKASKSKDPSKKDRYLFKRRDEAGDVRTTKISQVQGSPSSSAYEDGTADSAATTYVFQKRDHAVSISDDLAGDPSRDHAATSAHHMTKQDAPAGSDVTWKRFSIDATTGLLKSESTAPMSSVQGQVPDAGLVKKKKKKVLKRPAEELSSEKSDIPEKKKVKKLKKKNVEDNMEHPERPLVKQEGKSMHITVASGEDSEGSHQKKEEQARESDSQQVGSIVVEAAAENKVELSEMLADLQSLALNPFHGAERKRPAIVRKFFLKFRSLVFLKASSSSSPSESELGDSRPIRSPPSAEPTDRSPAEGTKTARPLKPSKQSSKHEDPTKGGRKRTPSERQEENAVKRAKKIAEVKSLGAEKRALLKNPEMQRADLKANKVSAATQQQSLKPMKTEYYQTKKSDRPPRVEEPTYLVMKFQSGSSLPSLVELKARFARFGPLDTSLSRVFYTTNTCRVAFLYKQDANVAYRYAVGSKSLFSNVKFMLRPVAGPDPPQQQQPSKGEDPHGEQASNRDASAVGPTPLLSAQQLKSCLKKPAVSDEPAGTTNNGGVRTPRVRFNMDEDKDGNPSKKEGVVQPQAPLESRNAVPSSSSYSEGGQSCSLPSLPSPPSVPMDVNSNNERFISSHPLQPSPPLPHPPQFHRATVNPPQHNLESGPRDNYNFNVTSITPGPPVIAPLLPPPPTVQLPTPPSIDISQKMMSLLTRCQDVVTNVKSVLGYVPYHSL